MKYSLLSLFICFTAFGFGQQNDSIIENYHSKMVAPRFGLSYQQNAFAEIGVSFHKYDVILPKKQKQPHFGISLYGAYISTEVLIRNDKNIIGPKIGVEFAGAGSTFGAAIAIETILYTDFNKQTISFTPKYGIPFGVFEIYYGYNIFTNNDLSQYIGRHRFSISININKTYWKKQNQLFKAMR